MELILAVISAVLSLICVILVMALLIRKPNNNTTKIEAQIHNSNELQKQMNNMLLSSLKGYNETTLSGINQNLTIFMQELNQIENRLDSILKSSSDSMKNASEILEKGLNKLQTDNEKKLEEMRQTVDEKLNVSLERRLTESFNVINNRLQSVYEGLGEMKQLANGVGDLKRVLTNVKTRGTWGEVQLGNLLEQMLAPNQYDSQVMIKNNERVDYVVKLPGKDDKN
ncbi:MAG: DNA recombination protein RmuC, partial [Clostridia bacterium]|nr:DNA recombination protein RmuC [Clostridia bacterium]